MNEKMMERAVINRKLTVQERVERMHRNDPQPVCGGNISSMKDFVKSTEGFDIAASLRKFETPEMIARRNAIFNQCVRN